MRHAARPALAAVTFLTVVPLGRTTRVEARDIARGAWLFPLVGGGIGALSGLVADAAAGQLPALAAGVLAVGVAAVVTGGMHLDALADTADALGGRTREHALEIMRDHTIGAFGATALIVVLALDASLLGALGAAGDALLAGLAAGAAGRAAMVVPAVVVPHARSEGQVRVLEGAGAGSALAATVLAGLLALPAGWAGLLAFAAAAVTATVCAFFAWRRFGGVSGDVLGATGALAQTAALVAATAALA